MAAAITVYVASGARVCAVTGGRSDVLKVNARRSLKAATRGEIRVFGEDRDRGEATELSYAIDGERISLVLKMAG